MQQIRKRFTYANVMSSLAVFLVLGGATAFAANQLGKNTVGTKQIKKNSITAAKIKNGVITGSKIKLSTLGTVPSATNATNSVNSTNATNAVNATNVGSVKTYSVGANIHEVVTLVKTPDFELAGFCDPKDEQVAPGLSGTTKGTVMIIYNRGSAVAFAETSDDDNYKMGQNEAVGFNYQDNEDGGLAMSTDGHFLSAPGYANLVADTSYEGEPKPGDNYPFSTACHFAGAAIVG